MTQRLARGTFKIIPAGAGSGKTYKLQKTLADWICKGLVAPHRIAAVTFTRAAASELRERIRGELMEQGMMEEALQLDEAYISTIHAFGLRLLQEFVFDLGANPRLEQLDEFQQTVLVNRSLALSEKADDIIGDLGPYGWKDKTGQSGTTPGHDLFVKTVAKTIGQLRSIGCDSPREQLLKQVESNLRALDPGPFADGEALAHQLHRAVLRLLEQFPDSLEQQYGNSDTARKDFRKNHASVSSAGHIENLRCDWNLWKKLQSLRVSNSRCKTPDGYDVLAQDVMNAASRLDEHPGPLESAVKASRSVLALAMDSLDEYKKGKELAGLVDYGDMLALAYSLLRNPAIRKELSERLDCLLVDEFQDTNPLAFSMLWELKEEGVPMVVVGDVKQAIMGFQNADHRLLQELEKQFPKQCEPLTSNWRTAKPLMEAFNEIGTGLFGERYQVLEPRADFESQLEPLEIIHRTSGSQPDLANLMAQRIAQLLEERPLVWDKLEREHRPLRPSDIAVLAPKHSRLEGMAKALRSHNIACQSQADGWVKAPLVELVIQALLRMHNPDDRHAALYLCVTELGDRTLQEALKQFVEEGSVASPLLEKLDKLAQTSRELAVPQVIEQVIETLGLYDYVARRGDSPQRRANLVKLVQRAHDFAALRPETKSAQGIFGNGIPSFLSWLDVQEEDSSPFPQAECLEENAVVLSTWHAAKGREWPVVVVVGADDQRKLGTQEFRVEFEDFSELKQILDRAWLRFVPAMASPEKQALFEKPLYEELLEEQRHLMYVAVTRAREKLILEWSGKPKPGTFSGFLVTQCGASLTQDACILNGKSFPASIYELTKDKAKEIKQKAAGAAGTADIGSASRTVRSAIVRNVMPIDGTPEHLTPSSTHGKGVENSPDFEHQSYGEPLNVKIEARADERGTLLHRCFEIFPCVEPDAKRISQALGFSLDGEQTRRIAEQVVAFESWVQSSWKPLKLHREVPVLAQNDAGTVLEGVIDLLVETEDGFWIVDHKSDQTDDLDARFRHYLGQLSMYREAVEKSQPKPVLGIAINWITTATVTSSIQSL